MKKNENKKCFSKIVYGSWSICFISYYDYDIFVIDYLLNNNYEKR